MNPANRLSSIHKSIIDAENCFNRAPHSVRLIAVSKKNPPQAIIDLYKAGQRDFAENTLQEGLDKIQTLIDYDICWHFIGPIQSNKTKGISEHFHWAHSIDRLKIAERLNGQRPTHLPPLNILIQVNINQESSKSGIDIDEVEPLCDAIMTLKRLNLRGLMAIPKILESFEAQKKNFHLIHTQYQRLKDVYNFDTLSIGMSKDYNAAISEGATMVRIGSALFGQRSA